MPFAFHDLEIYQLAKALAVRCYRLTSRFPESEKYALSNQINRAAVSVSANIVEGYSRKTVKDKVHFLNMSYGSLMELVCEFEIGRELNYITQDELAVISVSADSLGIKISAFCRAIEGKK